EAALDRCCEVRVQHPVSDETLYADTVIDPLAAARDRLASRGLLGRIAREPCLIELFSGRVGLADLDVAMARASMLRRVAGSSARALWVVSPFRPGVVLRAWALVPGVRWGKGVYVGRAPRGPRVIVTSELEQTRETLLLRLMGRKATLLRAIRDALELPREAWERGFVDRLLLRVDRDLARMVGVSHIPEELMLRYQQIIKEEQDRIVEAEARGRALGEAQGRALGEAQGRALGEAQGRALGEAQGRALGEAQGRALGEAIGAVQGEANALRSVLHARGFIVTPEFERRIAACRDLSTLRGWIVAAVTAPSIERVFAR
ncbi:MAG: hypothetical protein WCK28_22570, partial [Burkholderiales bacterium]